MPHPLISIRLSDRTYAILVAQASIDNQSVSQLIRTLAEQRAVGLRRAQIRAESEVVSVRYQNERNVRKFYNEVAAAGSEAIRSAVPDDERS